MEYAHRIKRQITNMDIRSVEKYNNNDDNNYYNNNNVNRIRTYFLQQAWAEPGAMLFDTKERSCSVGFCRGTATLTCW